MVFSKTRSRDTGNIAAPLADAAPMPASVCVKIVLLQRLCALRRALRHAIVAFGP